MSEDGVTYSFKDLFEKFDRSLSDGFKRLDGRLDEINSKIDKKADNTRVAALEEKQAQSEIRLEERFGRLDERFRPLETFVLTNSAVSIVKGRGLAFLASLVVAIIGALVYIALTGGVH